MTDNGPAYRSTLHAIAAATQLVGETGVMAPVSRPLLVSGGRAATGMHHWSIPMGEARA